MTAGAVAVLKAVAANGGHKFAFTEYPIGGIAIDTHGDPLPPATLAACKAADAVLLGAVGGPKWSDPNAKVRPEQGLLGLRAALGVYANLRPVRVHPKLAALSPLKNEKLHNVDLLFLRELTGGAYFGAKTRTADTATDECKYTVAEIERATRRAFALARERRKHVTPRRQGQRAGNLAAVAQRRHAMSRRNFPTSRSNTSSSIRWRCCC